MGSTGGLCSSPRAWGCGWNGARLLCFAAISWGAAENTAAVIVVNQTPPSICAMEGSEFTIECTFNTSNNSIKWFAEWFKTKNNLTAKVNNGTDRIILSADIEKRSLSLTVKKADVTDSGTYVCWVGSKDGTYPGTGTQVTIDGQPKAPVKCKKLCPEFSRKEIPQKLLKTYRKTEPSCPKAAIIFVTKKNREFCADPEASWVKEAVRQLNQASAPLNPPLSSTVTSAVVQEGAGVFRRVVGDAGSKPTQPSVPANPIHGAGTPVSHVSVVRTEEPNVSILTVQETKKSSTKSFSALPETVTPSTIHPELVANGSEVSIRSVTTPAADIPESTSSRFHSVPTPVMKSSESVVESRNKSTGSTISPTTDIPGTAPSRLNSDPTTVIKGSESPIQPTYSSVGSARNQTAGGLASAPSRFISDAPSIVNGPEIAKLSPTFLTPSLLESVPSKPVIGLTSIGQVTENSTIKPTAVLKGSDATKGSTPHPTSPGGESGSVSPNSGDERDAVSDSTADARTGSSLSPLGKKDPPPCSFPESISSIEMSVLSVKSFPLQNRAKGPSDGPLVSSILPASRTHILSLALLASILGICSAAVWMYVKAKVCPGDSAKETVQGLLFNQLGSRTNEYAMEAI